jgi:hypothetical protein
MFTGEENGESDGGGGGEKTIDTETRNSVETDNKNKAKGRGGGVGNSAIKRHKKSEAALLPLKSITSQYSPRGVKKLRTTIKVEVIISSFNLCMKFLLTGYYA